MNYSFKVNGNELTSEQKSVLNNFLYSIKKKSNVEFIFRGESAENLRSKLNIKDHEDLIERLNYFLFKIGEKGRVYQEKYFKQVKKKNIFSINDLNDDFINYIFRKIKHVLKTSKDPEIKEFKILNEEFDMYFQSADNKKEFSKSIGSLPINDKIKVRDYYLKFLHKVGELGFNLNSFLLSTSTSEIAVEAFTAQEDFKFVSWSSSDGKNDKDILNKIKLPIIKSDIFIHQKEITIKGALFPQDILGFVEISSNIFHVNPNLFNFPELSDYMIINGIPTDQTDFFEVNSLTNYQSSLTRNGDKFEDTN
ncbi:hypothetical protein [Kaistella sp.]|uniref:hypothetical protein n=1 Tax=Kaistella sp. TaxID=2782235 RepID=UPI0035A0B876